MTGFLQSFKRELSKHIVLLLCLWLICHAILFLTEAWRSLKTGQWRTRRRWSCRRSSWRRPNTLQRRLTANMRRHVSQLFTSLWTLSSAFSAFFCFNVTADVSGHFLSDATSCQFNSLTLHFVHCDFRWPVSWWSLRVTWNVQRSVLSCLRGKNFIPSPLHLFLKITTLNNILDKFFCNSFVCGIFLLFQPNP